MIVTGRRLQNASVLPESVGNGMLQPGKPRLAVVRTQLR